MTDRKFKCERLWNAKTLVDRTGLFSSIKHLYVTHKRIGIPYYKLAEKLWFDPVEVDEWIQKHRREFSTEKNNSTGLKKARLLKK